MPPTGSTKLASAAVLNLRSWAAASLSCLSIAVAISACGSSSKSAKANGTRSTLSSSLSSGFVDSEFPATGAQYADGSVFSQTVSALEDVDIASCMQSYGWRWHSVPVTSTDIALTAAVFRDNTQFPDLRAISRTGLFIPDKGPPGNKSKPGAGSGRISASETPDLTKCQNRADRPMMSVTARSTGLVNSWDNIVAQVEASAAVTSAQQGFAECVERHGTPPNDSGSLNAFLNWVTSVQSKTSSRAASLAAERHWVQVFVPCARRLVALQEELQNRRREGFLESHYEEISAAEGKLAPAIAELEKRAGVSPRAIASR